MSTESPTKKAKVEHTYELLYWGGIPGRGDFIRLAFEEAGQAYKDPANGKKASAELAKYVQGDEYADAETNPAIFAPPILRVGKVLLTQTAAILSYLGPRLGLVPNDEIGRIHIDSLFLTILDLTDEVHNCHHPIGPAEYYEDQKEEALRYSKQFRELRIPKYLTTFEKTISSNPAASKKWLVGTELSYADLGLFHAYRGLKFAFPKAISRLEKDFPLVNDLYERVGERSKIKAYLESDRSPAFGKGIFRHYPELDD